ncbi:hypothetical protein [Hymenobacter cheonanensis]|uniref:hypothetical protein n=1 Tax=Hymenobacter sp. CA2-7 TaxID=3063993 RepID=UPI002713B105|nr:hypothetical protein [Hymenobacter sp. CA2-7]MDO7885138.1 hypothetical protein [Hymenobacter sp. CA2-7]
MLRRLLLLLTFSALLAPAARAQTYEPGQNYVVRQGQLPYAGRTQYSVNVVVDGNEEKTRDFLQSYMKETYRIPLKNGLVSMVTKKNGVLTAKQVAGTSISSRAVDIYAATTALTDSTTEVALFGGFGEKTFFSPDLTSTEFKRLQAMLERYAPAARINAFRQQVLDAEAQVAAIDKEKEKINRNIDNTRANTAANLKRIEELLRQNQANAQSLGQDSLRLISNGQLREVKSQVLERRKTRLAGVVAK